MSTRIVYNTFPVLVTDVPQSDTYPFPLEAGSTSTYFEEWKTLDETVESVSVQNPKLKVKVHVAWRPKYPVVEPRKPTFHKRKPPVLKPRRDGQSPSSYARYLMKYRDLRDKYLIADMRNRLRFDAQMKKYEKRYQKYLENAHALKYGIESYRALPFCKPTEEWHPYTLLKTSYLPGSSMLLIQRWARDGTPTFGDDPWLGGPFTVVEGPSNLTGGMVAELDLNDRLFVEQFVAEVDAIAMIRLRNRVGKQIAHIGNLLAERHKSMQMLGGLLKRGLALLQRRKIPLDGTLSSGSDDFLMFQFGLRPLMSDIYAVAGELDKDEDDVTILRFRANFVTSRDYKTTDGELIRLVHHYVKVSYVIEFEIENAMLKTLYEYGLTNPLEIAWEMTPWSFVVDWFLPIGAWIRDVSSPRSLLYKQGSKTTTITSTVTSKRSYNNYSFEYDPTSRWTGEVSGSMTEHTKKRELLGESPLGFYIPKFKSPYSAYHVAETVALLIQRFFKR